jgi:phage-related tail protein
MPRQSPSKARPTRRQAEDNFLAVLSALQGDLVSIKQSIEHVEAEIKAGNRNLAAGGLDLAAHARILTVLQRRTRSLNATVAGQTHVIGEALEKIELQER